MSERRGTKALETWCRRLTEGYPGVKIENMTTSWRDGLAFCALIHHFRPELIDFSKLTPDNIYYNNSLAFSIAERQLGIPALLDAEDMVLYEIPDRLSILTYLSQFYQVFGNQSPVATGTKQGPSQRIVPKRPALSTDRSIISPSSTSTPSKVSSNIVSGIRRDPCGSCKLPVFLAERLNVGNKLFHRTCFRCARCNHQLSLANYYETETDEFCCETCPDEEDSPKKKITKFESSEEIDHEKMNTETSSTFVEEIQSTKSSEDTDSVKISLKEKLSMFEAQILKEDNENLEVKNNLEENITDTKAIEEKMSIETTNNIVEETHSSVSSEDTDSAKISLKERKSVFETQILMEDTKKLKNIDKNVENTTETTKNTTETLKNFEETSTETTDFRNRSLSDEEKTQGLQNFEIDDDYSTNFEQSLELETEKSNIEIARNNFLTSSLLDEIEPQNQLQEQIEEIEDSLPPLPTSKPPDLSVNSVNITNYETKEDLKTKTLNSVSVSISEDNILSQSILEDLSDQSSVPINASLLEESKEYPEDLNPFADEDICEENCEEINQNKIGVKIDDKKDKKDKIEDKKDKKDKIKDKSTNPFDEEEDIVKEKPPRPPLPTMRPEKKVVEAPKINLNPFWSDDEEHSDEEMKIKPVPLPRSKHHQTPEPTPRRNRLSNNASQYDSNSSLSSLSSSISHTPGRKKKPAPQPPVKSPDGSKNSSPSTSTHPSPKLTPKVRKNRKAPLPPSSTPFVSIGTHGDINISPIVNTDTDKDKSEAKSEESTIMSPTEMDIEKEKFGKDEKNRNRQSQNLSSPIPSDNDSLSLSISQNTSSDKSTHGKWKRKKGPAPNRPVPQRRQIKPLPLTELKRELDIIEMQQQGLEKQGVKLEQLIREKCEVPGNNEETSLDPEVEDLVLELFELVNEKNELFRKQAELMYLRRQQRLEEEHADLEYQIRCLMDRPERNKTDSDKAREEELINRLLEVVERRNEIVECLEMDRVRESEEDKSINYHLSQLALKKDEENTETPIKLSKKEKKKIKKEKKLKEKGKNLDVDKDIDETEQKMKKKKKWF